MKKLRKYLKKNWRVLGVSIFICLLIIVSLFFGLSSVPGGISIAEKEFINSASSLQNIANNPLNWPIKLPYLLVNLSKQDSNISLFRGISSIYGVLTLVFLYLSVRIFNTRRVSAILLILVGTSSMFLSLTRVALPIAALPFGVALLMLTLLSERYLKYSSLGLFGMGLLIGALSYINVLPLICLLTVFIMSYKLKGRRLSIFSLLAGYFLSISWLVYYLFNAHSPLKFLLGTNFSLDIIEWIKRLFILPVYIFARGPFEPLFNIARLPLLDIVSSVFVVMGVYFILTMIKQKRFRIFTIMSLVAVMLFAVGGVYNLGLFVPLIFFTAGSGIALLLQQWFTVFPKNPIIKSVAVVFILISVFLSSVYNLRRYFVAWPRTPATKIIYSESSLD